jgi:hypothetical protein
MKTSKLDNPASITLKYLLHLISIALVYGILLYCSLHFWLPTFILKLSKLTYIAANIFKKQFYVLLAIYTIFCYFVNNFVLHLYSSGKGWRLILSYFIDILIVPITILIMIFYNNKTSKIATGETDSLFNIYIAMGLLIIKEFIAVKLLSPKAAKRRT